MDGAVPTINLPGQEPTQTPTPFNVLSKAEVNQIIKREAEEKKLTAEEHLEIRGDFATGKQYLLSLTGMIAVHLKRPQQKSDFL